ncbi:MAG: NAD(P)/FAD-dependent oxidoreductase [Chitinophagaceae bacterium]|nr:NAD(P)/FAD-dependent oxidoreductase [Chitinophagaceae bacterium]
MQQQITLSLLPQHTANDGVLKKFIADHLGKKINEIKGYTLVKTSVDARSKNIRINVTLIVFVNEPFQPQKKSSFEFKYVSQAREKVIIIGAGPAGLFAALKLIQYGIQPIILERGKDVQARRRDLAQLNKHGIINPESNYCFGEGGAGTYSDGKLYTRSSKRGSIENILNLFIHFGADENIAYEAHPHIGTNKLPGIITAMRETIIEHGGKILFEKKVTGFTILKNTVTSVETTDGDSFTANACILATGHSARDIFYLLQNKNILLEAKPFALGIRIEHPQSLINAIQYGNFHHDNYPGYAVLNPASYSLVQQVNNKGVFSFCMCPGGIIAPAATNENEVVVNGWSPSKRNNPFANSGIVVQVDLPDALRELKKNGYLKTDAVKDPLSFLHFQQLIEQKAFDAGGGKFVAPAGRMIDFCEEKVSSTLPKCSYNPGIHAAGFDHILPAFINDRLKTALKLFSKKMKGFYTNEAVVVGVESRTSSPVRIPRHPIGLHHPQINNFYPCGEGAGYAGGIVSAAMDGERIADQLAKVLVG